MPGSGAKFWICIFCLLFAVRLALARAFISAGDSPGSYTFTQVINPNWSPKELPVAEILAAPFRKHRIPMPPELQEAVDEVETGSGPTRRFQMKPRANGQTVPGSSGQ